MSREKVTRKAEDSQLESTWAAEAERDKSKALDVLLVLGVPQMQVLKIREPRPSPVTWVAAVRGALPASRCPPAVTELPKIAELLCFTGLAPVLAWMLMWNAGGFTAGVTPRYQSIIWAMKHEVASTGN